MKPGNAYKEFYEAFLRNKATEIPDNDLFYKELTAFISDFDLHKKKVLEIGSSTGLLQDVVKDYTGIDIAEGLRPFYHKPYIVIEDGKPYPFPDATFDSIFTNAVFEHIPDINTALRETVRVLKPGGVILMNAAWQVRPWAREGYAVRPFKDLSMGGKLVKASIPLRDSIFFRALSIIPQRTWRTIRYLFSPSSRTKLDYKKIKANYEIFWTSDSDACNHIDPHAAILWFRANNCNVVNYPTLTKAFFVRSGPLIIRRIS